MNRTCNEWPFFITISYKRPRSRSASHVRFIQTPPRSRAHTEKQVFTLPHRTEFRESSTLNMFYKGQQ